MRGVPLQGFLPKGFFGVQSGIQGGNGQFSLDAADTLDITGPPGYVGFGDGTNQPGMPFGGPYTPFGTLTPVTLVSSMGTLQIAAFYAGASGSAFPDVYMVATSLPGALPVPWWLFPSVIDCFPGGQFTRKSATQASGHGYPSYENNVCEYTANFPFVSGDGYNLRWYTPPFPVPVQAGGGGNTAVLGGDDLGGNIATVGYSDGEFIDDGEPEEGGSLTPDTYLTTEFSAVWWTRGAAHPFHDDILTVWAYPVSNLPPPQNSFNQIAFTDSGGTGRAYLSSDATYTANADNTATWVWSLGVVDGTPSFANGVDTTITWT